MIGKVLKWPFAYVFLVGLTISRQLACSPTSAPVELTERRPRTD